MAMIYEWNTGYCEYTFEDKMNPSGNVFVTTLHWTCKAYDDAVEGVQPSGSIGTVDVTNQNRVYTLAALEAVPAHVMTGWVHQALNDPNLSDQTVQDIEDSLLAQWNNKVTPSGGGLIPE